MSRISIIVAIAQINAIGFENKLLYWLPNDLKRFKASEKSKVYKNYVRFHNSFILDEYVKL